MDDSSRRKTRYEEEKNRGLAVHQSDAWLSNTAEMDNRPATRGNGGAAFGDRADEFAQFSLRNDLGDESSSTSSGDVSCVDADEWDNHLQAPEVVCLDKTGCRAVYACMAATSEELEQHSSSVEMIVKLLTPPVAVTADEGRRRRALAAARERCERISSSAMGSVDDDEALAHVEVRGVTASIHCYSGVAIDTRCRIIGQGRPLVPESRSLLDLVAFCRASTAQPQKIQSVDTKSARSKLSPDEVTTLMHAVICAAYARLRCGSLTVPDDALVLREVPEEELLVHGNLSPGNIYVSPRVGEGGERSLHVTFADPLECFTFPMCSIDSSAFSLSHLEYIYQHVIRPAVLERRPSALGLDEEMHLRYEEQPYIPNAQDDIHALGALLYFMITGHTLRHGMAVSEAVVVEHDRDEDVRTTSTGVFAEDDVRYRSLRQVFDSLIETCRPHERVFFEQALDFIARTTLADSRSDKASASSQFIVSYSQVLRHPFFGSITSISGGRIENIHQLATDVESNIETFRMFAGSGPLQLRPMRNIFINHSASVFRNFFALFGCSKSGGSDVREDFDEPLRLLCLVYPLIGRNIRKLCEGNSLPSSSQMLLDVLPSDAVTVNMGIGALVIKNASDLDWTVSEDMLRTIGVFAVSFDYLTQLSQALEADDESEARAVCLRLASFAARLFAKRIPAFPGSVTLISDQQMLPSVAPFTLPTFISSVFIRNSVRCTIAILSPMETLVVENVSDSRLFFGPSRTALVHSVQNCEPIAIAADTLFLEGDITDCVLSLHLADNPRCSSVAMSTLYERAKEEASSKVTGAQPTTEVKSGEECLVNVQFIPYVVSYAESFRHFLQLGLLLEHQATRLSFPGLDVMRERQMFDLALRYPAEGCFVNPASVRCFGSEGFFVDYFNRKYNAHKLQGSNSKEALRTSADFLDVSRPWPVTLLSLSDAELLSSIPRYYDYIVPTAVTQFASAATESPSHSASVYPVVGIGSRCEYPFQPAIAHGMIYRHSGPHDLFVAPGEATNWSVIISNVTTGGGDAGTSNNSANYSPRKDYLLASLKGSIVDMVGDMSTNEKMLSQSGDSQKGDVSTGNHPVIIILEAVDDVLIENVSQSTIVVMAASSAIRCVNVSKSKMYLACKGRISFENCSGVDVYGYSTEPCVISGSSSLQLNLNPLLLEAPQCEEILRAVGAEAEPESGKGPARLLPNRFCEIDPDAVPRGVWVTRKALVVFSLDIPFYAAPTDIMLRSSPQGTSSSAPRLPLSLYVDLERHTSHTEFTSLTNSVVIHHLVDCSVLRMEGSLSPARAISVRDAHRGGAIETTLEISNVNGGVVHIADAVKLLYIRDCSGPLDIIVAAAQSVIVDNCQGVSVQSACFDFLATNSHGCHFALHVNSQPKVDDGYCYWRALQAATSECRRVKALLANLETLANPPSLPDFLSPYHVEAYSLASTRPCSNLRFSPLNIACDNFEFLLESACVNQAPNLYDQPVLVRLPPPREARALFRACDAFFKSVRVPTPMFASPMRGASAQDFDRWSMATTEEMLTGHHRKESPQGYSSESPESTTSLFVPHGVDSPIISPFTFEFHKHSVCARSLIEVYKLFKKLPLWDARQTNVTGFSNLSELAQTVSLLAPLLGGLTRALSRNSGSSTMSRFGVIEGDSHLMVDRAFSSSQVTTSATPTKSILSAPTFQVPCFDRALLACAPLQGTAIGGVPETEFLDFLSARVEDDTRRCFEPLVRILAQLKWLVQSKLLGVNPPRFDQLQAEIADVVVASVEGEPFDEVKRLAMLLASSVLSVGSDELSQGPYRGDVKRFFAAKSRPARDSVDHKLELELELSQDGDPTRPLFASGHELSVSPEVDSIKRPTNPLLKCQRYADYSDNTSSSSDGGACDNSYSEDCGDDHDPTRNIFSNGHPHDESGHDDSSPPPEPGHLDETEHIGSKLDWHLLEASSCFPRDVKSIRARFVANRKKMDGLRSKYNEIISKMSSYVNDR